MSEEGAIKTYCDLHCVGFEVSIRPEKAYDKVAHYTSPKGTLTVSVDGEPTLESAKQAITLLQRRALVNA